MKKYSNFTLRPTLVSLCVASAMGVVPAAHAQDAGATQLEEVIVTGIRGSLRTSTATKRNESGVVDAISAEDIGKFPDANLAESLQRITGVSIDRQNNEGNQISVRGMGPSFNLVTLNGRQMPVASSPEQENISSATQSRAFNFAEIAAESVSGVNVHKTVRADLPTGGIGATVDIKTARPFDFDEQRTIFSIGAIHDLSVEDGDSLTPEIGGLFTTRLSDKVGLLINGSYSKRDFTDKEVHTDGWQRITPAGNPDEFGALSAGADLTGVSQLYRPITNISEVSENERERTNAQAVLQFEVSEDLTATVDYTLSRYNVDERRYQTGVFGTPTNHGVQALAFDQNGTFTNYLFSGAADFLSYENELVVEGDSVGFNLDWQASEKLSLNLDLHSSTSESQPDGELNDVLFLLQGSLGVNFGIGYSGGPFETTTDASGASTFISGGVPGGLVFLGGPSATLPLNGILDPAGLAPLGTFIRNVKIENDVDQAQLKGTWDFNSGSLQTIDFGLSRTDYEVATAGTSSNFVFQGLGVDPATFAGVCTTAICPITSPLRSAIEVGGGAGIGGWDTILRVPSPAEVAAGFPIQTSSITPSVSRTNILEETTALYLNFNFETELSGMPVKVALGGRYEDTEITGISFQSIPIALRTSSNTEQEVIESTEESALTVKGDYAEFLPAIDFQIQPSDDTVVRASFGRSLARPDLNAMRPSLSIADTRPFGPFNAVQGNPDLEPYLADNFDLAFEWYYGDESYAAINYFYKDIDNYIGTTTVVQPVNNINGDPLTDPSARFGVGGTIGAVVGNASDPVANFNVLQPFNSGSASVDGIELAIQHLFGDTGFGMQANLTMVDSDAEFNPNALTQTVNLIGLSDSANLVGFYENEKYQVRVALNWRDEFLFSENQLRVQGEPVFFDSYTQIDVSGSYALSDRLSLFGEILNLTGEDQTQFGRFSNQFLFENDQKPRFTFGVKGEF